MVGVLVSSLRAGAVAREPMPMCDEKVKKRTVFVIVCIVL